MSGVRCTPSVVARHLRNSYAEYAWWSGCRDLNPGPLDLHVSGTLRCAERRSTWWTVIGNCEVKKSSNRPVDGLKLRPGGLPQQSPARAWTQGCRKAYRSWCESVTKITPLPTAG